MWRAREPPPVGHPLRGATFPVPLPVGISKARSDALPTARNGANRLAILSGRSLPDAGEPPEASSGIRCPVYKPILTMICDDHNRLFLQA